jgi:hypothetical protein
LTVVLQIPGIDGRDDPIKEFVQYLEQFVNNLAVARSNMQGYTTLADSEYSSYLDSLKSVSDFQGAGRSRTIEL